MDFKFSSSLIIEIIQKIIIRSPITLSPLGHTPRLETMKKLIWWGPLDVSASWLLPVKLFRDQVPRYLRWYLLWTKDLGNSDKTGYDIVLKYHLLEVLPFVHLNKIIWTLSNPIPSFFCSVLLALLIDGYPVLCQYNSIDHLFIKKVLLRPIYISHIVTHFIVRQLFLKSPDIWSYKFWPMTCHRTFSQINFVLWLFFESTDIWTYKFWPMTYYRTF